MEIAKCCATCKRSEFKVVSQKIQDDIYTGIASQGKCYQGKKPKSCNPYNICDKHKIRDDIYKQSELSVN